LVAAVVLAGAGGLASVAGLWAVLSPEGWSASVLPLSPPHEALANAKLNPDLGAVDLDAAERATRRVLSRSPGLATAWVRLAYIETWRHGRLTPKALEHLETSYEIAPLGPDVSRARTALIFESWAAASPPIRAQALREVAAIRGRDREAAQKLADDIRNPEGRLAIGMAIATLQSEDALRRLD
jgi:hypothetical protein